MLRRFPAAEALTPNLHKISFHLNDYFDKDFSIYYRINFFHMPDAREALCRPEK